MGMGSKTDLYSNYQKAQQNLGQNQSNPFANLKIDPINSVQPQTQQPQQRVVQPQTRTVTVQHYQDNRPVSQGVVGQKVTKRTKKGDTYSYADKYDHSRDIKPRKVVPITFRIDADEYERFKMIAQRERVSMNQLILRAMSQFR